MTLVAIIIWSALAIAILDQSSLRPWRTEYDISTMAICFGLMVGLPAVACGPAPGDTSSPLDGPDGSVSCDYPADHARLYELSFRGYECGGLRPQVRRLDGPSNSGACRMDVTTSSDMCSLEWWQECSFDDGSFALFEGELVNGSWWSGDVVVDFYDADGDVTCSGTYEVDVEVVF